jgi:hypothetical protein
MTEPNRRRRGQQSGQMLVAVIVLLTLLFFVGSAMALAVSSSLHTIAQTNSMDSTAYAAETAIARAFAVAQAGGSFPAATSCPSSTLSTLPGFFGGTSVNKQALKAGICYVAVDSDVPVQTWSVAGQSVKGQKCVSQVPPWFSLADDAKVWGVIGWHSESPGPLADVQVSIQTSDCGDRLDNPQDNRCPTPLTAPGVLYFRCDVPHNATTPTLNVVNVGNPGSRANVSDFVVREAEIGIDCVATTIGQAGPATFDEAEWRLLHTPNTATCDWATANQTLWDRVLP